ncbi:putative bifunctional diguanylate cyclase/phosphodiesterase [Pseudonocardia xinjiangensis]|uniref:putative bifunctional diguanylate cyclase/phosphodiesterase n=1 Tax=Pseudonocardia xinjiangensis TaxID=75289 RepID=UPI003D8A5181
MHAYSDEATAAPPTDWVRFGRPQDLVAQTRWLFTLMVLALILLSLPGMIGTRGLLAWLLVIAAFAGLFVVWSYRYLSGRAPLLLGVVEAALVLVAAVAGPAPATVFTFLFGSLWLHALYGSTRGVLLHTSFLAAAILASLEVWHLLPGREGVLPSGAITNVVSVVPVMFVTAGVARYLVLSLFAREQSQKRDAALVRLGSRLIGVTERRKIQETGTECARAICEATPDMQLLIVILRGSRAAVVGHAGSSEQSPCTVPISVLPANLDLGVQPLPDSEPLKELTGVGGTWIGVPLPETGGWILLGAEPQVPTEAVVAVRSMVNQVALALRNSDAHFDLSTLASQDPLTGLANRAAFNAALATGIADPERRLALLFLDLDDFKIVNDGLGHSAGDELLCSVATRMRAGVRSDDLCARIGGDEFAVLLRDRDDEAAAVGQRLVELIAEPVSIKGRLAQVGASVGLAFACGGHSTGEQLVQRADIAMYAAKAKGKNRVQMYDPSLLQDDGRLQFEAELAAAAGAGELVLHFQPIVSVREDWCVAVESLVRWQHPTRGLLQPSEFIPTAERTGAIVAIGAQVLRRACSDAVSWSGPSGPLAVHVNVSAAQLIDPDFVATVRSCVTDFAMPPDRLVLEITESMVLDSPAIRTALAALAALGVTIAIDDFGTGYSALSTLRTLPLDIVKIDKSFLSTGPSRAADQAVVEAIVQMAGRLKLKVVAEGVERIEQLQFLRSAGADATQGYLHLRPTPAPEFGSWLEQTNATRQEAGSVPRIGPRQTG